MSPKVRKALIIAFIVVDVGVTLALTILSIFMLIKIAPIKTEAERAALTGLIGYFANHPMFYLWTCVVPMFVLLAANILLLVMYVRKSTKKEPVELKDLSKEQKAALREALRKELEEDE